MLRVALTGGVASGKSAAAAMLQELGAAVSRSDEVGRRLMGRGQPVFQAIVSHFGATVLAASGDLDRAVLADIAFKQGRVEELNRIVHPAVIAEQKRWMDEIAATDPCAIAVVESALVFETKHGPVLETGLHTGSSAAPWRTRFDRIVVVVAPEQVRRARYVQRVAADGTTRMETAAADFERRAAAQWTDQQKAALADFVLHNGASLEHLRAEVERLFVELQQESVEDAAEAM